MSDMRTKEQALKRFDECMDLSDFDQPYNGVFCCALMALNMEPNAINILKKRLVDHKKMCLEFTKQLVIDTYDAVEPESNTECHEK